MIQRAAMVLIVAIACMGTRLFADATITLPQSVNGPVGSFVQVPAQTSGAVVKWLSLDAGLNLFPVNLLKDTHTAVCTSASAGTFRLIAWTADASGPSDAATCTVVIGTPTPPPPPVPADPLAMALQTAYTADADPAKAAKKENLQALYYQAATNTVKEPTYTTVGALLTKISSTPVGPLAVTDLSAERAVIASYLNAKYQSTQALDAATRSALGADLGHVADALGNLNGTGNRRGM